MSQVRIFLRVKVKLDIINCSSVRHDSMGQGDLIYFLSLNKIDLQNREELARKSELSQTSLMTSQSQLNWILIYRLKGPFQSYQFQQSSGWFVPRHSICRGEDCFSCFVLSFAWVSYLADQMRICLQWSVERIILVVPPDYTLTYLHSAPRGGRQDTHPRSLSVTIFSVWSFISLKSTLQRVRSRTRTRTSIQRTSAFFF